MKLLCCHIENFGIFSDFDFTFEEGITLLYEENGYGKSTLAAFLKAMLYGFPRTGARNITENERKRYDPWQGGKYGGYLEFETEGVAYRVTRYFGKTAAKDSFSLYDLTNRRESDRFSEKLGEELFQLDAASFARSTYLTQSFAGDLEATTSIRTKLSDLVDDTNDLNNYDSAEKALRDYRTRFRAYRGDGGKIHDLEVRYQNLEHQKFEAEQKKTELSEVQEDIEKLKKEKSGKDKDLDEIRRKQRLAAERKNRQFLKNRKDELTKDIRKCKEELRTLDERYPAGYPTVAELREQKDACRILQQERERLEELKLDAGDQETVNRGKTWFADSEKTDADIAACDEKIKELTAVRAGLSAQMLPEEKEELQRLEAHFPEGIPSGVILDECIHRSDELENLKRSRVEAVLPAEKEQKYQKLKRLFSGGVPTEEEISERRGDWRRVLELQGKKQAKTTKVQETAAPKEAAASKGPLVFASLGGILLAVGLLLLVLSKFVPGIILVILGFGAFLGAIWLHTKALVSTGRQAQTSVITVSAITDEENQELYDRQRTLNDFLLGFYEETSDPENQLLQLRMDRKEYLDLCAQKKKIQEERDQIEAKTEEKTQQLKKMIVTYFPAFAEGLAGVLLENPRQAVSRLSEEVKSYRSLKSKEESFEVKHATDFARAEELEKEIDGILDAYEARNSALSADACLQKLRERAVRYQQATERVTRFSREHQQAEAKKMQMEKVTEAFGKKYQLTGKDTEQLSEQILEQIEADLREKESTGKRLDETEKKLQDFLQQNPELDREETSDDLCKEELPDIEALVREEQEIIRNTDALIRNLNDLRQKRKVLSEKVERIPDWEDEMARLSTEREESVKKCELTDRTLEFLSEAKDRLSNNYVGKVEQRFEEYAKNLLRERIGRTIVDKDLKLTIDEKGDAREVASFSAGMKDCIALCMRLSLIDALFEEEKPFLILDDPFVNLDDAHTKRALEMLEELSKDHQIVYLVCNSSRMMA